MLAVGIEGHNGLRAETQGRRNPRPHRPSKAPIQEMAKQYDALLTSQFAGSVAAAVINDDEPCDPMPLQTADYLNDGQLFVVCSGVTQCFSAAPGQEAHRSDLAN